MEQEITEDEQAAKELVEYSRRRVRAEKAETRLPEKLETLTEKVDVLPFKVIRRRIVRPKFKRKATPDAVPFTAPLPPWVLPGGLPAASLIAFLLVAKYVDHLPLYRLEKGFKQRLGVKLPRQRLCDWTGYAIENWP